VFLLADLSVASSKTPQRIGAYQEQERRPSAFSAGSEQAEHDLLVSEGFL
jgi:hypothetical protein